MNQITKINPAIAPQAHAAISSRCLASSNGTAVFQGLLYEITVGGEVWHVGNGNQTFENTWDDTRFGFEVATPTIPMQNNTTSRKIDISALSERFNQSRFSILRTLSYYRKGCGQFGVRPTWRGFCSLFTL